VGKAGKIEKLKIILDGRVGRDVCKFSQSTTKRRHSDRDYGQRDQMQRPAVSIISNIAEGYESQNNRTFIRNNFSSPKARRQKCAPKPT
jgi:hypothetical protein